MQLCDPITILERINKNSVYEIFNYLKNKENFLERLKNRILRRKAIPENILTEWQDFVFDEYFKLIIDLAKSSKFEFVQIMWDKCVNFSDLTSREDIDMHIANNDILISLFKAPSWYAKSLQVLSQEDKLNTEISDYLILIYNPNEDNGKKVSVAFHALKTPDQILDAELDYKAPFTKKSALALTFAISSIFLSILELNPEGPRPFQLLSGIFDNYLAFTVLLSAFVIGLVLIIKDIIQMILNLQDGSINKLVTKNKKSMRRRIDSTQSLVYLESYSRRIDSTIAISVLELIKENEFYFNDTKLLKTIQTNLSAEISSYKLSYILQVLLEKNYINIGKNMLISLKIESDILEQQRNLDQMLYEDFDLIKDIEDQVYHTYGRFRVILLELCIFAILQPPNLPKC